MIEAQYNTRVFDAYGHTERVVDAVECERHQGYHVSMEYGILELLGADGAPVRDAEMTGKVVGTGFGTLGMPLIRYVTDDLAAWASDDCGCSRQLTHIRGFQGRLREFLVANNGLLVPFGPFYSTVTYEAEEWGQIRELKFIQKKEGELILEVVPLSLLSQSELEQRLLDSIYEWLDARAFDVKINMVDHVSRTKRGKLPLLDQGLNIDLVDLARTPAG